ncbi:MAG: transcriptional regulator, IclR family [Actinomycetia bacterium]|nr:transcriptional regulator, IclR family [Actinomycetes bacterium]
MGKGVPAAARALAILDFLAAHPTDSFSLSELAKELGIGSGSAHALLGAMTQAGYLVRHPSHKTFRLGPSAIAVGHAALESHPVIEVARDEMRRIADELDLECLAAAPLGDELVMVARVGGSHAGRTLSRVGDRLPLIPPLGTMYVAWAGDDVVAAWLSRGDASEPPERITGYLRALESARALGYSVGVVVGDTVTAVQPVSGDPKRLDLDPDLTYEIAYVAASVFDPRQEVALVINLDGFTQPLDLGSIVAIGQRLLDAARVITRGIHGRLPEGLVPRRSPAVDKV